MSEILPDGIQLDADGWGTIWWRGPERFDLGGIGFGSVAVQDGYPLREALTSAMSGLLDGIQDHISESPPFEPWPVVPGHPRQLPLPEVEIDSDGNVTAGYMWDGGWVLSGPPLSFPLS
jgi:hypothetical protein